MASSASPSSAPAGLVLTPDQLLQHWQAHRRVTRRMIVAFPEDALFTHAVGGMRPFAQLVMEFVRMAVPIARGVATGRWEDAEVAEPRTKEALLARWDAETAALDAVWPTIPPHRFQEHDVAFGQWAGPGYVTILYAIDNEIHHRGQGYVYLRSLGIEPPAFWDRS
ncbi:MAG TPA: DinB family protein [Gemmatimonadaceae bacterium]|nr:DinB family protein [Gemmatimonadaceae bacterium]